jgi:mRNA-degrading endonuclease YafQ of YafQ-DinJ toxin-antitoxin module
MKNKIDPEKAFKKSLKIKFAEKGAMRAEKKVVKAVAKGKPAKAAFKNAVADAKYTKAMREMSSKSARADIGAARKVYKTAKKGM